MKGCCGVESGPKNADEIQNERKRMTRRSQCLINALSRFNEIYCSSFDFFRSRCNQFTAIGSRIEMADVLRD